MVPITGISSCRRATLAVAAALVCVTPGSATLVARYTFDNVDTTITGDGTMDNPFNIELADASGNGHTAINIATQLWQSVYGAAIQTGQPGRFGQAHKFFRDPSVFQTAGGGGTAKEQANTTYYVDAASGTDAGSNGDIPDGAAPRTFSLWFNQEVDVTAGGSQDKLFGYGDQFAGEAFDIGLNGGGIELRHFGGSIVYGSGLDFDGTNAGWHHLAVRVNNNAATFADVNVFLDGSQLSVASGSVSETLNTTENIDGFGIGSTSISAFSAAQNGFQGWLDEFRIYDNSLSDSEIIELASPGPIGDYNGNGVVDAADYTVWRDTLGSTTDLRANGDDSGASVGVIDQADYALWKMHFGNTAGGASVTGVGMAVPEPAGWLTAIVSEHLFPIRATKY